MPEVNLTINNKNIIAEQGKTILEVAKENGIFVPTLCHDPRIKPYGACRVCLVEVEGARGPVPSCSTVVTEGMTVQTDTVTLQEIRKVIIELLLANHPMECLTCQSTGNCALQDLAYFYGIEEPRFKGEQREHATEDYNPVIERDHRKCILCGRCVRICDEVMGLRVWGFANRGFQTIVTTPYERSLFETMCVFCGQCVSTCPTGALTEKLSKYKGRVWETEQTVTVCPYCGVGCQIQLRTKNGDVVGVTAEVGKGVNNGNLCVKGRFGFGFINHPDRLTNPLIRKRGRLTEASWEEAFEVIAKNISKIRKKHGVNAIAALSSAKCTNEENYLMQKFMRAIIGTNNIDHCARLCHSSTVAGLAAAFGSGAMTNSIDDVDKADAIFVIGSNTTEAHPVIALSIIKAARNGSSLIVADPRKIDLVDYAEVWLRHRPGTDIALLNGMMNVAIRGSLIDKKFIKERTENFEELKKAVAEYTPDKVEKITGVPAADIRKAARLYAKAKSASIFYSMGITQHIMGTDNVLSIANLAMLTGNIGRPGSGVDPLRGQNNVQGACDMGALPNVFPGYQSVADAKIREKFEGAWKVKLPGDPGLTVVEMIDAACRGEIKAMYVMGENPVLTDPDSSHVEEALQLLDFLVVQDIFLTETAQLADVVLPGVSFAEKNGTFTNTERRVQRVRKAIAPVGNSRPDWRIICDVARAMGYDMDYTSPAKVMEEIASVTPIYAGISYDRIGEEGIQWPCPSLGHPGTSILHTEKFTRGKGRFHAVEHQEAAEQPDKEFPLILTTGRWLYQYHTGSMSRRSSLEEISHEPVVEISPEDARRYKIKDGDLVQVVSRRGRIKLKACVTGKSCKGTVFIPFHFAESPANKLTISALDPKAKIPELKVCAVRIEK